MLIPTNQNIKTITDMRENALKLLDEVKSQGLIYLFHHSHPKAVMLSIDEFQKINELLEDHLDELEASKLAKEERGERIPFSKIISKYKKKSRV